MDTGGYRLFSCTRIGAAHVRGGFPCQDASTTARLGGLDVAVVADGHGNRRHFRSDRGSRLACEVTLGAIEGLLGDRGPASLLTDEGLNALKRRICDDWRSAVLDDWHESPWTEVELDHVSGLLTEDQLEALVRGEDAPVAYGSTVCAIISGDEGWAALQLGDGGIVRIGHDGQYDWPMPPSLLNEGNRTASLCLDDPLLDFRHCSGQDRPAGLIAFTDGIDKVLPPRGELLLSLLHWVWNDVRTAAPDEASAPCTTRLERTLDMLTERSRIGDDVSMAGMVDAAAEDHSPFLGEHDQEVERSRQRQVQKERRRSLIAEAESAISYNQRQLVRLRLQKFSLFGDPEGQARLQADIDTVEGIVSRRRDELRQLRSEDDSTS